jgi:hypothetical protein
MTTDELRLRSSVAHPARRAALAQSGQAPGNHEWQGEFALLLPTITSDPCPPQ